MADDYKYHVDTVAFHVTYVCSHQCPFCYAGDDVSAKPKHPPLEKATKVVDALGSAKVKNIMLLGGDPGAYPHAVELAKYAVESYGIRVSILSNTLLFPNSSLEEAAKYISAFETTIHHVEPRLHDQFCRREGAYQAVIGRLKRLSGLGRETGIAINILPTISDKIFDLVNRIVNVEKVKLNYIIVQRIVPFGRAAGSSNFTLTRQQAEQSLNDIKRIDKELGIRITVEDPFPLCILPNELKKYMTPCKWGISIASVNIEGALSRCGADPRYRLGNILERPLLEIWNTSEILESFRNREYLPGRCKICNDFDRCGGGCPLSCEIEKDHGTDYLYHEYSKLDREIHGELTFDLAREDELSSILQIEWGNFPGYGHVFSVASLKRWYAYNPRVFWVIRDEKNWVLGYATLVPIKKALFERILAGVISSISDVSADIDLSELGVLRDEDTDYFFLEVVATIPSRGASRAGSFLIRSVGNYLLEHAKYVATSPITEVGVRLCKYFGFKHVADERFGENIYPIYALTISKEEIRPKLNKF